MTKEAAAIVHLAPETVRVALGSREGELTSASGEPLAITALSDATVVRLGIGIGAEPGELAARLRELLGDLLDEHDDERGVPVYPSSYTLEARSWDAAVDELGEAADWVPIHEEAAGFADMLSAFGLGSSDVAQMQAELAKGGGNDLLASAMRMAQQMAESGALADLAQRMGIVPGAGGEDPLANLAGAGAGLDLEALALQARRALAADPELEAQLRRAMGAEASSDESDDASENDERASDEDE